MCCLYKKLLDDSACALWLVGKAALWGALAVDCVSLTSCVRSCVNHEINALLAYSLCHCSVFRIVPQPDSTAYFILTKSAIVLPFWNFIAHRWKMLKFWKNCTATLDLKGHIFVIMSPQKSSINNQKLFLILSVLYFIVIPIFACGMWWSCRSPTMPLSGDEPTCPKFQPNIFDPSRCHDCLRQRHLHSGSGEGTEAALLQISTAEPVNGTKTGTDTSAGQGKRVFLKPIPSQTEEKDSSSRVRKKGGGVEQGEDGNTCWVMGLAGEAEKCVRGEDSKAMRERGWMKPSTATKSLFRKQKEHQTQT